LAQVRLLFLPGQQAMPTQEQKKKGSVQVALAGGKAEAKARRKSDDNTWRRMRTPSPESRYWQNGGGGATYLEAYPCDYSPVIMQQQCLWTGTYSYGLCFMPIKTISADADVETAMGSFGSDWQSTSCPSVASWSSWSFPPSSAEEASDTVETDSSSVCLPCSSEEALPEVRGEDVCLTAANAPSKGSIGHPHYCASGCKYVKKPRGCKDGANCDRCHICSYRAKKGGDGNNQASQGSRQIEQFQRVLLR